MSNIITTLTPKRYIPIPNLIRMTLQFIYEEEKRPTTTQKDVERAIEDWYDWICREKDRLRGEYGKDYIDNDTRAIGTKGTTLDETEFWIQWCSLRLVQNEEYTGEVARNKRDILLHGADWRKLYRLPEAYTPQDFAKAMYNLKKAMKDNPGDYQ